MDQAKEVSDQIIEEVIDASTILGGAWDCMTDSQKERIQVKLTKIVGAAIDKSHGR